MTRWTLDSILDLRVALEGHAAYLAAHRRSNPELGALQNTISEMAGSSTRRTFRLADSQFHSLRGDRLGHQSS